jgi:hypothetical protein
MSVMLNAYINGLCLVQMSGLWLSTQPLLTQLHTATQSCNTYADCYCQLHTIPGQEKNKKNKMSSSYTVITPTKVQACRQENQSLQVYVLFIFSFIPAGPSGRAI